MLCYNVVFYECYWAQIEPINTKRYILIEVLRDIRCVYVCASIISESCDTASHSLHGKTSELIRITYGLGLRSFTYHTPRWQGHIWLTSCTNLLLSEHWLYSKRLANLPHHSLDLNPELLDCEQNLPLLY